MAPHASTLSTIDREPPPPPAVRDACEHLLTFVGRDEPGRVVTDLAAWLLIAMIGDAMWCSGALREQLVGWSDDMVAALVGDQIGPAAEHAAAAYRGLYDFIEGALGEHRHDAISTPLTRPESTEPGICDVVRHSPIDVDEVFPSLLARADRVAHV